MQLQPISRSLRHFLPAVTIETCATPACPLLRLRRESFVVSDFDMPDPNGLGLLRAARGSGADASFILITRDSTENMLTDGLRLRLFALNGQASESGHVYPVGLTGHRELRSTPTGSH